MPTQILMPALSPTMTEGNLAKWLKSEGDAVESGDVIAEIETDKATMEVEAVDDGILGKILVSEGTEGVAVNTPIAVLLEEGESAGDIPTDNVAVIPAPSNDDAIETVVTQSGEAEQHAGAIIDNRDILYAQGVIVEPPPFDEASFTDTINQLIA